VGRSARRECDKDVEIAVHSTRSVCPVCSEDTTNNKMANTHTNGAEDKQWPATGVVDEEESEAAKDDK